MAAMMRLAGISRLKKMIRFHKPSSWNDQAENWVVETM